ncbi:MAG TPA: TIGR02281 family clan AA aspartic protease [Caulobacteraceae bacterium]|jgi:aspartyl protease family protein|nr:TIGR02281 family clan AA aspartic protease [Caulobacteraceae bacterium]
MLRLAVIAVIGAVSAAASAEAVISFSRDHAAAPLRPAEAQVVIAQSDTAPAIGEAASVAKADDGHYWAEAAVNGEEVRFLVDTGSSAVALTPDDALRLGFDPKTLNYDYTVNTASGQARAAEIRLNTVAVAGAEVDNVDAFVIESGLKNSLLGMTYLGRLSQFEATPTSLILRP